MQYNVDMIKPIDTSFDFRTDSAGKDPDAYSPTLKSYHKLLWSKQLPNGANFMLEDNITGQYLVHTSNLGKFSMTSDSVMQTFVRWERYKHIIEQLPQEESDYFMYIGYTIGGMMLFPGYKVNGKMTINGERGFNTKIADRFDLTLECIRRHYAQEESPLGDVLVRYADFFKLFVDFRGYVDFFLLQDLVDSNYSEVKFFTDFDGFSVSPLPNDLGDYMVYKDRSIAFVNLRNARISSLALGGALS